MYSYNVNTSKINIIINISVFIVYDVKYNVKRARYFLQIGGKIYMEKQNKQETEVENQKAEGTKYVLSDTVIIEVLHVLRDIAMEVIRLKYQEKKEME